MALGVEVPAEVAGGDRAGDRAGLRVDGDRRIGGPHLGVGGTDQQRGGLVGRVGEAAGAGAGRRGEVGGDTGGEADPVVAGLGGLVGVAEVGGVDGVLGVARRGRGDLTGVRVERDVTAAARAARAGHVGEAEAPDAGGVVLVAAGRGRAGRAASGVLRAPGEHAEGHDGAREDIAAVLGADQRIDVGRGVLDELRRDGGGRRQGGVAPPTASAAASAAAGSVRPPRSGNRDMGRKRMTRPLLLRTGRAPQVAQAAGTVTCATRTTEERVGRWGHAGHPPGRRPRTNWLDIVVRWGGRVMGRPFDNVVAPQCRTKPRTTRAGRTPFPARLADPVAPVHRVRPEHRVNRPGREGQLPGHRRHRRHR